MMILIARYGEIFLKGSNRLDFERKLIGNIQKMFGVKVLRKRNRLLVEGEVDLRRVFGLISFSPASEVELEIEEIKKKVLSLVEGKKFSSFAVAAKRMDSKFMRSQEINEQIGALIAEKFGKAVDLTNPDLLVGIEIIDGKAYIFTETVECFGGLPVGVEGKVGVLVENENSILAGLLMMKRGCSVVPISFEERDISLLQKFSPMKLDLKIIKDLKEIKTEGLAVSGELEEDAGLVAVNPLVGLSQGEISEKISIFRSI